MAGKLAPHGFNVPFQVRLRRKGLRVGIPLAGGPVADFSMQRVEHAMGPTRGVFGYPLLFQCNGCNVTNRHE